MHKGIATFFEVVKVVTRLTREEPSQFREEPSQFRKEAAHGGSPYILPSEAVPSTLEGGTTCPRRYGLRGKEAAPS